MNDHKWKQIMWVGIVSVALWIGFITWAIYSIVTWIITK